jgi:TonB-dependent starch-binding outer membrane protein SusC
MGSANYFNLPGIRVSTLGDPNLKWETTTQFDAGVDVGLLHDRLSFTADYYIKTTRDLLNYIQLPGTTGFRTYLTNNGTVRNTGLEFGAQGQVLTGAFGWHTSFTLAYNQNELLQLPGNEARIYNYGEFQGIARVGDPIGAFYGYKALGVYSSTEEVKVKNGAANTHPFQGGDIIFQDVNLDGIIDEADKKVIGNSVPDVFGGFSNTFSYKAFDLRVFMDYTFGNQVYNAQRARLEAMSGYDNQATTVNSRWRNPGDQTDMPRLLHGDAVGNTRFSSRWVEDAAYIRFKTITLSYNVPAAISEKLRFLNNGKIYATAQNLHTFTRYKGYDPEVASITNQVMYGVDYGNVPQLRSFIVGLRLAL